MSDTEVKQLFARLLEIEPGVAGDPQPVQLVDGAILRGRQIRRRRRFTTVSAAVVTAVVASAAVGLLNRGPEGALPPVHPLPTVPAPTPTPTPTKVFKLSEHTDPAKDPIGWTDAKLIEMFPTGFAYQSGGEDEGEPHQAPIYAQAWVGVPAGDGFQVVAMLVHRAPPVWKPTEQRFGPFDIAPFESCTTAPGVTCHTAQIAAGTLVIRRTVLPARPGSTYPRVSNAVSLHRTDGIVVTIDSENFSLGGKDGPSSHVIGPESAFPTPAGTTPEPVYTLDELIDLVQQVPITEAWHHPYPKGKPS